MSDTPPSDQPTSQGSNFTATNYGGYEGSAQGPALQPEGGWLAINGSMDLSACVVGPYGACISKAYVSNQAPVKWPEPFQYCVWVYGQGPKGAETGRLDLVFTDETNSNYSLTLYSSTPAWHYVAYNSSSPGITQMSWQPSNY